MVDVSEDRDILQRGRSATVFQFWLFALTLVFAIGTAKFFCDMVESLAACAEPSAFEASSKSWINSLKM